MNAPSLPGSTLQVREVGVGGRAREHPQEGAEVGTGLGRQRCSHTAHLNTHMCAHTWVQGFPLGNGNNTVKVQRPLNCVLTMGNG